MQMRKQTRPVRKPFFLQLGRIALILAMLISPTIASAQQTADGDAVVENAWARAARQGGAGAAYFSIRNTGSEPLRLIDVRTDLASIVTLHKTEVDANGVARMSAVPTTTIEPGATLTLEPGGIHAMMMDLEKPLLEGQSFPLRLKFYDMDELTVDVPILGIAARGPDG